MPLSEPVNLNFDTVPYRIQNAVYTGTELDLTGEVGAGDGFYVNTDKSLLLAMARPEESIFQYDLKSQTTIKGAKYSGKSVNINTVLGINSLRGFTLANGGKTLVVINGSLDNSFYTTTLTTPYDIETAVDASQVLSPGSSAPSDCRFNPDGTKFLWLSPEQKFFEHNLSTPFDISTADAGISETLGQDTSPTSFAFNNDGTKVFNTGQDTDTLYGYSLGTAYSISGITYDNISFVFTEFMDFPQGVHFINAGNKFLLMRRVNPKIFEFYANDIYNET